MTTTLKPTIAFIDDDERILRAMQVLFRSTYTVFTTTEPDEYINYIRFNLVHVAVSDQRMPLREGVDILREIKDISPYTMRILLTGYADLEAIIDSINEGEIFRYLTKPCKADEIKATITQAVEIAQANFLHARSTPAMPAPIEDDYLNTMVGLLNGIDTPSDTPAPTSNSASASPVVAQTSITQPTATQPAPISQAVSPVANVANPSNLENLLLIDDSFEVKRKVEEQFADKYHLLYAQNLEQAFDYLSKYTIGVCITDTIVGRENVTPIIHVLKQHNPNLVVLVQTEFQDASNLIDLINKGQIFRCLPKPIRSALLDVSVVRAFEYHHKLKSNVLLSQRHSVEADKADDENDDDNNAPSTLSPIIKNLIGRLRDTFS